MTINPLGSGPDLQICLRQQEPASPTEPFVAPPVDPERPGQFVAELLALAERHAAAVGSASAAPGLLLAATVAAAERYGQGVGIGVQMVECGALLRDRTWQRFAAAVQGEKIDMPIQTGETAAA